MTTWDGPTYEGLEAKRKGLVDEGEFGTFSSGLGLRPRRYTSWLGRAEQEMESGDYDAAFIFYWIAFEAAYAESRTGALVGGGDRERRKDYFHEIITLDVSDNVGNAIIAECADPIMEILKNKYVFQLFWADHKDWEETLQCELAQVDRPYSLWRIEQHTKKTLNIVFDRLYVLRNQLIHGGATWKGSMNRNQVAAGARNMHVLIPRFAKLMTDNPATELRALRCNSWRERAEREMVSGDQDAAFIFYWIAFNAAYAEDRISGSAHRLLSPVAAARPGYFEKITEPYFGKIIELDVDGRVNDTIQSSEYATQLLRPYRNRLLRLRVLFDHLYRLRNQLIHGSATWNDPGNRVQVEAGARILSSLVPLFIDLMMDEPKADWGDPPYPAA